MTKSPRGTGKSNDPTQIDLRRSFPWGRHKALLETADLAVHSLLPSALEHRNRLSAGCPLQCNLIQAAQSLINLG